MRWRFCRQAVQVEQVPLRADLPEVCTEFANHACMCLGANNKIQMVWLDLVRSHHKQSPRAEMPALHDQGSNSQQSTVRVARDQCPQFVIRAINTPPFTHTYRR